MSIIIFVFLFLSTFIFVTVYLCRPLSCSHFIFVTFYRCHTLSLSFLSLSFCFLSNYTFVTLYLAHTFSCHTFRSETLGFCWSSLAFPPYRDCSDWVNDCLVEVSVVKYNLYSLHQSNNLFMIALPARAKIHYCIQSSYERFYCSIYFIQNCPFQHYDCFSSIPCNAAQLIIECIEQQQNSS